MTQLEAILAHIVPVLLVIFRIGGLMIYAPVFGSQVIPSRVKVFLSFMIGAAIYPALLAGPLHGVSVEPSLAVLAPLVALEMLIGITIGFVASIPLIAMQTGGLIMGQQMGLGFAQFFNPAIDDEGDVVGQVLFFMALAGFLAIGGHEALVLVVLHSFEQVPLGGFVPGDDLIVMINGLLISGLELSLRVAAPLLALIFLETLAMGFMAKTIPQLNILSLGFPVRILVGLLTVAIGLVVIDEVVMDEIDTTMNVLFTWLDNR